MLGLGELLPTLYPGEVFVHTPTLTAGLMEADPISTVGVVLLEAVAVEAMVLDVDATISAGVAPTDTITYLVHALGAATAVTPNEMS